MLKNAVFFSLPAHAKKLWGNGAGLSNRKFHPVGPFELSSSGFVPPVGNQLVKVVGDFEFFCLQEEKRLLPASVIKKELARRVDQLERETGRALGRLEQRDIRNLITNEMLPKAFTTSSKIYCWVNFSAGILAIDAPSIGKKTDAVLSAMIKSGTGLDVELSPIVTFDVMGRLSRNEAPGFITANKIKFVGNGTSSVFSGEWDTMSACHTLLESNLDITDLQLEYKQCKFVLSRENTIKGLKIADEAVIGARDDSESTMISDLLTRASIALKIYNRLMSL